MDGWWYKLVSAVISNAPQIRLFFNRIWPAPAPGSTPKVYNSEGVTVKTIGAGGWRYTFRRTGPSTTDSEALSGSTVYNSREQILEESVSLGDLALHAPLSQSPERASIRGGESRDIGLEPTYEAG